MIAYLARKLRTRLSAWVLAAMVAIPILLGGLLVARPPRPLTAGVTPDLPALAGTSALAFTAYVLYMCAPILLVAIAALFAGDSIAGEAATGSLRYLLTAPIRRGVLLWRAAASAVVLTTLSVLVLVAAALVVGVLAFGWGPLETPIGGTLEPRIAVLRMGLATLSIMASLAPFLAAAFLASVVIDSPLGAVAAGVAPAVVSQMLDSMVSLGSLRVVLPTHYQYAWGRIFIDPPDLSDVRAGAMQAAVYTVLLVAAAVGTFARRDITS